MQPCLTVAPDEAGTLAMSINKLRQQDAPAGQSTLQSTGRARGADSCSMNTDAADILLVEDSPTTAELFVLALKANKSNAVLRVVRDGVAALDLLHGDADSPALARAALPRLVLLDLHMPGLNGFEVLEHLRADDRTRLLPVVVLSASDEESYKRKAIACGANDYVDKPMGFTAARDLMSALERRWLST